MLKISDDVLFHRLSSGRDRDKSSLSLNLCQRPCVLPLLALSRKAETWYKCFYLNRANQGLAVRPGGGELGVTERDLVKGGLKKGLPPAGWRRENCTGLSRLLQVVGSSRFLQGNKQALKKGQ